MLITLDIPNELATRLEPLTNQLPRILELGLRELNADAQLGFEGTAEALEILALRPSEALQARLDALLEKNRTEGLNSEEEQEWERYQYLEHLIRIAKAKAHLSSKVASDGS